MDLSFTDEQRMLSETASNLADQLAMPSGDESDLDATVSTAEIADQWRKIVDFGVPSLRSPALCGIDDSAIEIAIVAEQMARTLVCAPVIGQAVIVPEMLEAARAHGLVEQVAAGELRLAPAFGASLDGFADAATPGIGYDAAGAAQALVVVTDGDLRQLCMVALDPEARPALDLTCELRDVASDLGQHERVGEPISEDRWTRVESVALTAIAADLVGVMQGALDDAVRYAGQRVQFGVPIGSFQAIQHLLADALVRVEGARGCVWHAAWATDHLSSTEALMAARTAKAYASAAGRDVVETTVQVFGGMAITWSHPSHVRLRRTLLHRRLFGDESVQHEAIARMRLADREMT